MPKRKCKHCGEYKDRDSGVNVPAGWFCCFQHALDFAASSNGEKMRDKVRKQRTRELKAKVKSRSDYMREAQAAFNAYIRRRDEQEPCICCGRPATNAIQWHAGHYLTVGARPEHRFNEMNCHKQTSYCNNYLSGNVAQYRINLVKRYGLKAVEGMESDNKPKKYTIEELKEITATYKRKLRELESE